MLAHTPILIQLAVVGAVYGLFVAPCVWFVNKYINKED